MIYEDPAFAERMLRRFRNLIDYQLGLSLRTHTTLRDEISFLTDYLELEKSRRSAFGFGILGAPELLDTRVPVLLFIPFVENAVKFCGTADGRIPAWTSPSRGQKPDSVSAVSTHSAPALLSRAPPGASALATHAAASSSSTAPASLSAQNPQTPTSPSLSQYLHEVHNR